MTYQMSFQFDLDKGILLCAEGFLNEQKQIENLTHWVCNLKDQEVRKALIQLGWTPPKEPTNASH